MYEKFEGAYECVPVPTLDGKELEAIGRVITSAFTFYNVFPFQVCKTALKYALYENVSDKELFASYMNFLPPREMALLTRFADGKSKKQQAVIDILSESKIFERPTQDNIKTLCLKAAKISLIRLPSYSMKEIRVGMGDFWNNINAKMIDAIYACTMPTSDRLIACMEFAEKSASDQKITT